MTEKKVKKVVSKKKSIKEEAPSEEKNKSKKASVFSGDYFYGLGKRKTSIARVRIYPVEKSGNKSIIINNKELEDYFPIDRNQFCIKDPFDKTGLSGSFGVLAKVSGGGFNAQAEAIRLAISRAIVKFEEGHRKVLKDLGFLTRDSRVVERKKPGLRKARRSPQWAKR